MQFPTQRQTDGWKDWARFDEALRAARGERVPDYASWLLVKQREFGEMRERFRKQMNALARDCALRASWEHTMQLVGARNRGECDESEHAPYEGS